ncbi:MAG: hypothetical protein HY332_24780, partial [Chloroflexi bacterium]|nr:hypothetical protein [Chloroflexota bacterium]
MVDNVALERARRTGRRSAEGQRANAARRGAHDGNIRDAGDIGHVVGAGDDEVALLAAAAHELRTPLTSLRATVQLAGRQLHQALERGQPLDPGWVQRLVQVFEAQTDRLCRLVEAVAITAGLDELALHPVVTDLTALVRAVVAATPMTITYHQLVLLDAPVVPVVPVANGADTTDGADTVGAAGRVWASVDPVRLEQAVQNLLSNAIKFSPEGGEIVVSVAALDAQTAQLAVRDHGVGIPPADRPYIFERYYRGYRDRR